MNFDDSASITRAYFSIMHAIIGFVAQIGRRDSLYESALSLKDDSWAYVFIQDILTSAIAFFS